MRVRGISGGISMIPHFLAEHPELTMARKPGAFGPAATNDVFTRLDLVQGEDLPGPPGPPTVNDVRLYVSDDNNTYRLYDGPIEREEIFEDYPIWEHTSSGGRPTGQTRRSRVLRLKNLNLRSKFSAIYVDGRDARFSNSLINLIYVFGENGDERMLTYGVVRRTTVMIPNSTGGMDPYNTEFREVGVEFDVSWGQLPSAVTAGDYMSRIRTLDSGADGVELRVRNHSYHFAWSEFGFEQPVRDEFLKRHGVDLWKTDDFDKATWRKLRGEGYTQFIRQVKQLCASRKKPLGLHVSPTLEMDPVHGAAMEIEWDWRTWLKEGLADSVTLKEVWPKTALAEEVLSLTRPRGVKAIYYPYAAKSFLQTRGERGIALWIRQAREGGCDGYQFYEATAVIKGTSDKKCGGAASAAGDVST